MIDARLPEGVPALLIHGVASPALPAVACAHIGNFDGLNVVVTQSQRQAEIFMAALECLSESPLPMVQLPELGDFEADDPRVLENRYDRLTALSASSSGQAKVLVVTPRAMLQPAPKPEQLEASAVSLKAGTTVDFQALSQRLVQQLHYANEAVCEAPGQFSVRGGLIDIYPVNAPTPYRLDFFGDELEGIRAFDPTTQRTDAATDAITLLPAETVTDDDDATPWGGSAPVKAFEHLPNAVQWVVLEPGLLASQQPEIFQYPEGLAPPSQNIKHLLDARQSASDRWLGLTMLEADAGLFAATQDRQAIDCEALENYRPFADADAMGLARVEGEQVARERFLSQLLTWQTGGYALTIVMPKAGEADSITALLQSSDIGQQLRPTYRTGQLRDGFRLKDASQQSVFVAEAELLGRRKLSITARRRRRVERKAVDDALDFAELADGDPLVHLSHGICLFRGLQTLDVDGNAQEVISLEFDDAVTLHVKLSESHLLSRYVGLTKTPPKLGRLGSSTWSKTRAAAERATLDFAAHLLRLQAERDATPGHAFAPDVTMQHTFEAAFPFNETKDQLQAIHDAKADMERERPMDRLLCGDVGFGKTEVAIRACLKAALDGKQAALLVPTTVLCQQHFNHFRERFADQPVVVEMLSRFRSPKQRKEILRQLADGSIDIIVGTHSLLSKQVTFKDLGLLVIDEEHRFGVRQKEKIKALRANVDVLAMSATPIPRTLYGALVGVRDLSVIETPPHNRLPIETFVKPYDPELIRKAMVAELDRGGQVFYLHNRVQTIENVVIQLRELLPNARIGMGHGQMDERQLERVMVDFVDGKYDVLVCTTIIESGLDIPNCNTLIIEGADRFGLGQLYQLRGRVGRFNRQAYAYLLLHRHAKLLGTARQRLTTLRQHNQLGSGFRVAMRDLELRGSGNLLGPQQSGHIAGVGFELYCQLLRQSVARLQGDASAALVRATLRLDFVIQGEMADIQQEVANSPSFNESFAALKTEEAPVERIAACLPANYISEARLRIDGYRKAARCGSRDDLRHLREEWTDRFGKLPGEADALLLQTEIRVLAEHGGLSHVETRGSQLRCRLAQKSQSEYLQVGRRFPRLTQRKPLKKLIELRDFLLRHQTTHESNPIA